MKKLALVFVFALLAVSFATSAFAQVAGSPKCWNISGFNDVFILSQVKVGNKHKAMVGYWEASSYFMPVTGALENDSLTGNKRLSLHTTNSDTLVFAGAVNCNLDSQLDKTSIPKLQGLLPSVVDCDGGAFNITGFTLVRIDCITRVPLGPVTEASTGKDIGAK